MRIVISSGHGKYIRGASGSPVPPQLDEVDQARLVVEEVASGLRQLGVDVVTYHDNWSTTQNENLNRIVDFHNAETRDLDVSVHFNAYDGSAHGTEVLWVTQEDLAAKLSAAISLAGGFTNRGAKYRDDLFVLNNTEMPCVLLEVCFCDSPVDSALYREHYSAICAAIAETLAGNSASLPDRPEWPERPDLPPPSGALLHVKGSCSWFGGPGDQGVDADEDLAFLYDFEDAPHLFLYDHPPGTTGLARRLDPGVFYVACRWDYDRTPKEMLREQSRKARVSAGGKSFLAYPADWGPHQDTGRVADLSPALMDALGLATDGEVEVTYPAS
jgi:N-acetylmuramoyl-L-alanine amidase